MEILVETNSYNERRYSKPWIAIVSFNKEGRTEFSFGNWVGTPGNEGVLLINAEESDIVAVGQKDFRGKNTTCEFHVVESSGELTSFGENKLDAYKHWKELHSETKKAEKSLNLAELVVEKQRLLERIAEIDEILNEKSVAAPKRKRISR